MNGLLFCLVGLTVLVAAGPPGRRLEHGRVRQSPVRSRTRAPGVDLASTLAVVSALLRTGVRPDVAWSRALAGQSVVGVVPTLGQLVAGTVDDTDGRWSRLVRPGRARPLPVAETGSPADAGRGGARPGPPRAGSPPATDRSWTGDGWLRSSGRPSSGRSLRRRAAADGTVGRVAAVIAAARLAEELGAPLAGMLDRVALAVTADAEAEQELAAALSGPRATARVLAWLPLLGVVLAVALGADPLTVTLGGGLGTWAVLAGLGLLVTGRLWVRGMLRAATGRARGHRAGFARDD